MRDALAHARRVVVVEKAFAVGAGGIVGQNVRDALGGRGPVVYDVVAGLGGRPITQRSLRALLLDAIGDKLSPASLTFLDLDTGIVERELERPTGPHAENILRDLGVLARPY